MDIAAMSMAMGSVKVQQQASIIMAKKVMNLQETNAAALIETMQQSAPQAPNALLNARA